MLKKTRIITGSLFFLLITLLFLDFTGIIHQWLGWMAKIQLVPAILASNALVIVTLVLLTLLFGRVYCSAICPLGVLQDGISNVSGQRKGKKNRFRYSPAISWLRYGFLGLFVVCLVSGISVIASLLDPYAAYGRIAASFLAPLYRLGNNLLAFFSEKANSYAFYTTDVWIKSWITFGIAALTLTVIFVLAWRNGRTYCNTVCPIGTLLGFASKFSLLRIQFNTEKCTNCTICERACKASCIDIKTKHIDHSRCVACFNCIGKCKFGGIQYSMYSFGSKTKKITENPDGMSRRNVLSILGLLAIGGTLKAQQLHVDGGLAAIENKKIPNRNMPIVPPGALGIKNLKQHCTACQLCISACPNNILRPSNKLATLMQPEISFERGYCRPECVECSQVCPTSAIRKITTAGKSATAIGAAVWIQENCIVNTNGIQCKKCSQACPTGAITLIDSDSNYSDSLKIPLVDKSLCIGCGACEYLCPARPFSAIYVEGNVRHHTV